MSSNDFATLGYAVEGAVATVTLRRPERKNAIGPQMTNELLHALERARGDAAVRVLVLTGAGGTFCAGGDLAQMSGGAGDGPALEHKGDYADLLLALVRCDKPVVARVEGAAMGGGLGLVAACTFALASDDAQFGTPEINLGLFPMMIMAVLARTVPRRPLLEMMLRGQRFGAARALELGLLNRAVPRDALDDEVRALCDDLAKRSPTAIARGLAAYARLGDLALDAALPMLRDELFALLGTEDAQEGLQAFFQKRTPEWKGR